MGPKPTEFKMVFSATRRRLTTDRRIILREALLFSIKIVKIIIIIP